MQRFGRIVKLRTGGEAEYDRLHAAVWPDVLAVISSSGVRNYSIYRYRQWLFSYFELPEGMTLDDMGRMWMQNEACLRWENLVQTLQEPLPESGAAGWWVAMAEVFHCDGVQP